MERIVQSQTHAKKDDPTRNYQLGQKKTLEVNPRHPVIKELLSRVESDPDDPVAVNTARLLYQTATLRSGFSLDDTLEFSKSVEMMMRDTLGVSRDEAVEEIEEEAEPEGEGVAEEVPAEDEDFEKDEL